MFHWQASSGWLDLQFIPAWCCRPNSAAKRLTPSSDYWERTMSIFGKIMSAIFGTKADAAPAGGGAAAGAGSSGGAAAAPAAATVDVAPILDQAVKAKGEKLEGRNSILGLMKALRIDSSFAARQELAQ